MPNQNHEITKELEELTSPFYALKDLARTGWVDKLNLKNPESVASHTLLMIVIALYFASKYSYSCKRRLRLIEMILIHDLAEALVGDITPDSKQHVYKKELENNAFDEIMSTFPDSKLKKGWKSSWEEFNSDSSSNSKLVHLIDKIEMLIQANYYLKHRNGITKNRIKPFRNSTALFLENICLNPTSKSQAQGNGIKNDLEEIKEILAHLCKL